MSMDKYFLGLIFLGVVSVILVNPIGEFALNDDWIYYDALRQLLSGTLTFNDIITPFLIMQLLMSALVYGFFSFSFSLGRLLTLSQSLLAVLMLYKTLLYLSTEKIKSFFLACMLMFFPLYFLLSFTFMTDIPSIFMIVTSCLFFLYSLQKRSSFYIFLSLIFAIGAIFIRQTNIVILVLMIIFYFVSIKKEVFRLKNFLALCSPIIIFFVLYIIFLNNNWLPIQSYTLHFFENSSDLIGNIYQTLYYNIIYLTLFALPFILSFPFSSRQKIFSGIVGFAFSVFHIFYIVFGNNLFPFWRNNFSLYGLGPRLDVLSGVPNQIFPDYIFILFTFIASFFAPFLILLFTKLIQYKPSSRDKYVYYFAVITFFSTLIPISFFKNFDRYILPSILFFIIAISFLIRDKNYSIFKWSSWITLIFFVYVSIGGTSDYLNENRLKWKIASDILKSGVEISDIDAGYEWLGWNRYHVSKNLQSIIDLNNPWYIQRLFPDNKRLFIISYHSDIAGYRVIERYPYFAKLMLRENYLYLLKKE